MGNDERETHSKLNEKKVNVKINTTTTNNEDDGKGQHIAAEKSNSCSAFINAAHDYFYRQQQLTQQQQQQQKQQEQLAAVVASSSAASADTYNQVHIRIRIRKRHSITKRPKTRTRPSMSTSWHAGHPKDANQLNNQNKNNNMPVRRGKREQRSVGTHTHNSNGIEEKLPLSREHSSSSRPVRFVLGQNIDIASPPPPLPPATTKPPTNNTSTITRQVVDKNKKKTKTKTNNNDKKVQAPPPSQPQPPSSSSSSVDYIEKTCDLSTASDLDEKRNRHNHHQQQQQSIKPSNGYNRVKFSDQIQVHDDDDSDVEHYSHATSKRINGAYSSSSSSSSSSSPPKAKKASFESSTRLNNVSSGSSSHQQQQRRVLPMIEFLFASKAPPPVPPGSSTASRIANCVPRKLESAGKSKPLSTKHRPVGQQHNENTIAATPTTNTTTTIVTNINEASSDQDADKVCAKEMSQPLSDELASTAIHDNDNDNESNDMDNREPIDSEQVGPLLEIKQTYAQPPTHMSERAPPVPPPVKPRTQILTYDTQPQSAAWLADKEVQVNLVNQEEEKEKEDVTHNQQVPIDEQNNNGNLERVMSEREKNDAEDRRRRSEYLRQQLLGDPTTTSHRLESNVERLLKKIYADGTTVMMDKLANGSSTSKRIVTAFWW